MIPVFLQVLPLLSGVMFAVDQIPEKWQWILSFNPMTSVIAGWRWAVLDAAAPDLGQLAVGVARRRRALRRRARRLPLVGAALRGHDLMSVAIEVEGLSKKYRLGEYHAAYGTLRETLVHATKRLTGRSTTGRARRSGRCATSPSRSPRARCSASSAATAPASRRSSRSSRGSRRRRRGGRRSAAASGACSRSGRASTRS